VLPRSLRSVPGRCAWFSGSCSESYKMWPHISAVRDFLCCRYHRVTPVPLHKTLIPRGRLQSYRYLLRAHVISVKHGSGHHPLFDRPISYLSCKFQKEQARLAPFVAIKSSSLKVLPERNFCSTARGAGTESEKSSLSSGHPRTQSSEIS
jgi:hypothetical protein